MPGGDAPPDPPSVCDQIWRALNSRNLYSGTEMYLGPTWILYTLVGNFAMTGLMKTASLGLLEVHA